MSRAFLCIALCLIGLLAGCGMAVMGAVAVGESRRANSPEVRAQRELELAKKMAIVEKIQEAADAGNDYARIELAKKCFETGYPCKVDRPSRIFEFYANQGFEIAIYYYGSYKLGLDPFGYSIEHCRETFLNTSKCVDRKVATELLNGLIRNGCEYETRAYEKKERIYPCSLLDRANRP